MWGLNNLFEKILTNKEKVFNKFGENVSIDSIIIEENNKVFSHFYNKDSLHEMRSISKVLIALAYGIAIDKGLVELNDNIYPVIKDLVTINEFNLETIKSWRVKHLLTYSCGYDSQMFSERFIKDIPQEKYLSYVLNYKLTYNAGERYTYNNADIFLLSVYFQERFKENIKDFVVREIFAPLKIDKFIWEDYNGYCPGGTGLYITHESLFKIGKLILNKGKFDGNQIISREYIENMCSTQISTPYAVKPERVLPKEGVGYVMHISKDGYAYKDGSNGQYLIVNFKKNLLITILSSEKDMSCVTEVLRGLV